LLPQALVELFLCRPLEARLQARARLSLRQHRVLRVAEL